VDAAMDLFTYQSLGTLTGAVAATVLIAEFCKQIWPQQKLSTRWIVLLIAEVVVLAADIAANGLILKDMPLDCLNGLLVASSAMGSWQVVHDLISGGINGGNNSNTGRET
jgi:hypothetical protein